jgi:hypothetical protein
MNGPMPNASDAKCTATKMTNSAATTRLPVDCSVCYRWDDNIILTLYTICKMNNNTQHTSTAICELNNSGRRPNRLINHKLHVSTAHDPAQPRPIVHNTDSVWPKLS